jgi:hypothetical protein
VANADKAKRAAEKVAKKTKEAAESKALDKYR